MQNRFSAYWAAHGMYMSGDPEQIMQRAVQRALAINSPNLTGRFFNSYGRLALLPPMAS